MCFSVQVEKELKALAKRFNAQVKQTDLHSFLELQRLEAELGPGWIKKQLGLKRGPSRPLFKEKDLQGRIYPGSFCDVMVLEEGKRVFKKMRYRVRPAGSREEIPSKFNVFNCRIDSLETRQTWKKLFMRQHGLFPFSRFFEWVEKEGKPTLISFAPETHDIMWAPCLWDTWTSADGNVSFSSFAIVTDDPPPEISEKGHDRCPIFLAEDMIDSWLSPQHFKKEEVYSLLKNIERTRFTYAWAA